MANKGYRGHGPSNIETLDFPRNLSPLETQDFLDYVVERSNLVFELSYSSTDGHVLVLKSPEGKAVRKVIGSDRKSDLFGTIYDREDLSKRLLFMWMNKIGETSYNGLMLFLPHEAAEKRIQFLRREKGEFGVLISDYFNRPASSEGKKEPAPSDLVYEI